MQDKFDADLEIGRKIGSYLYYYCIKRYRDSLFLP